MRCLREEKGGGEDNSQEILVSSHIQCVVISQASPALRWNNECQTSLGPGPGSWGVSTGPQTSAPSPFRAFP